MAEYFVDVCLASYNGSKFIVEQINSILHQLPPNSRLLISDDGSTDETIDVVKSMNDPRICLLSGPQKGVIRNFEYLLSLSDSEFVFLADQDDIWREDKIKTTLTHLASADLVVSNAALLFEEDVLASQESMFKLRGSKAGFLRNLCKNGFVGSTMAFRGNILACALPFPKGISMHDQWLGLLATRTGVVSFIPDMLIEYRRHEHNVTGLKSSRPYGVMLMERVFMCLLVYLRSCMRG